MTQQAISPDQASARKVAQTSFIYGALAECLDTPDGVLANTINSGQLATGIREVFGDTLDGAYSGLSAAVTVADLEAEYTRLFESNPPGRALCSLFCGHYQGDRRKVMEQHLRLYDYFELDMPERIEDVPDHLCAELEFLRLLSAQEAEALRQGDDIVDSLRKAQKDFILRFPLEWLGKLKEAVDEHASLAFYRDLVTLICAIVGSELARLNRAVKPGVIDAVDLS